MSVRRCFVFWRVHFVCWLECVLYVGESVFCMSVSVFTNRRSRPLA